ncbi:hypothetical protein M3T53_00910 [Actinomyces sp. B33]|nr:hypothetical protein [Actinomyces sp. B33]
MRVLLGVGAGLAVLCLIPTVLFGIRLPSAASQTAELTAQVETINEEIADLDSQRTEYLDKIAAAQADSWCHDFTREGVDDAAAQAARLSFADDAVLSAVESACPDKVAIATAYNSVRPSSFLTVTISSCSFTSPTNAHFEGTVTAERTQALSAFPSIDVFFELGSSSTSFGGGYIDSMRSSVTVPTDGTATTWTADLPVTDSTAGYCGADAIGWWPTGQ